jgi:hypothetical protein
LSNLQALQKLDVYVLTQREAALLLPSRLVHVMRLLLCHEAPRVVYSCFS